MASNDSNVKATSSTAINVIAIAVLVWYCIMWSISIVGCLTGRRRYRLRPRSPLSSAPPESVPGVSILRPLKGLDANLYENLESTFTQEYPKSRFQVLLSVAEETDQALPVVRSLLEKYPDVDADIIIGEEEVGVNPKVNNLMRSYKRAKFDILWVMDSNVQVEPGTLARSVDALEQPPKPGKRKIGVVHHVPFAYLSDPMLGSRVEAAFLNTNHARMYLALNTIAIDSCVMGKSCLYRRSDLERVTGELKPSLNINSPDESRDGEKVRGLAAFGRYLAEDNMIGAAIWHELGMRHSLSCDTARNIVGSMTFRDYVQRRVRWIRVRKRMVMSATLLEPFTESVFLGILTAWAIYRLWAIPTIFTLIVHFCAWLAIDLDVYESLAGYPLPSGERIAFLSAWMMRELCACPIWAIGVVGNEVEWRGRRYKMLAKSEVERAGAHQSWLAALLHRNDKRSSYEQLDQEAAGPERN